VKTPEEIKWCLENRDLVTCWLEKRGWHEGDWYTYVSRMPREQPQLVKEPTYEMDSHTVWLPTTDDVLEMLVAKDIRPRLLVNVHGQWIADGYKGRDALDVYGGDSDTTPLIALMELLKSCDSTVS
jgi:hypothetical protein